MRIIAAGAVFLISAAVMYGPADPQEDVVATVKIPAFVFERRIVIVRPIKSTSCPRKPFSSHPRQVVLSAKIIVSRPRNGVQIDKPMR